MALSVFNAKPIIFSQVVDSSIGGVLMYFANTAFKKPVEEITGWVQENLQKGWGLADSLNGLIKFPPESEGHQANLLEKIVQGGIGALKSFEDGIKNNSDHSANLIVQRAIGSIGNLANAAIQLLGAENQREGGAKKAIVNGIFSKVIQSALGGVYMLAANEKMIVPLGNTISKALIDKGVVKDEEIAQKIGYGWATEAFNAPFSAGATLLANIEVKPAQSAGR